MVGESNYKCMKMIEEPRIIMILIYQETSRKKQK